MKSIAFLAVAMCVAGAQADWVSEMRLTLANYALSPVKNYR